MEGELITDKTIETFFDTANQPWFKEEDVGQTSHYEILCDRARARRHAPKTP